MVRISQSVFSRNNLWRRPDAGQEKTGFCDKDVTDAPANAFVTKYSRQVYDLV